jgi:hypothetical protein
MDLQNIWNSFLHCLNQVSHVQQAEYKKIAGIPFLYIKSSLSSETMIIKDIHACSRQAIKGRRLSFRTVYVRNDNEMFVFRHRFFVPQEKMFCCGNNCIDCIRYKN